MMKWILVSAALYMGGAMDSVAMSQTPTPSQDEQLAQWRALNTEGNEIPKRAQYLQAAASAVSPGMVEADVVGKLGEPVGYFSEGLVYYGGPESALLDWPFTMLIVHVDSARVVTRVEITDSEVGVSPGERIFPK